MICEVLARREGFSLAETALSLAILALVIGALVPGLLSMRAAEQARATQTRLEAVMRASAAFVQANGCFPCPSTPASQATAGRGWVRGDTNAALCNGCSAPVGLVPFRALGLSESFARDGYNHWLTFSVDSTLTANNLASVACKAGDVDPPCSTDDIAHSAHKKGLCAANLSGVASLNVFLSGGGSAKAAILVLSHGANAHGAFAEAGADSTRMAFPSGQLGCNAGVSGAEACNANGSTSFVAATPGSGTDPFDDQMLYFDRNALVASAGGAACNTAW